MLPLIAVIAAAGGAFLVYKNWDQIKNWLSDFIPKIKELFERKMQGIAHAAAVVAEKVKDTVAAIKHRLFYKEEGKWMEETTKREIPESEVPPFIRAKIAAQEKAMEKEADITHEMELELNMKV